VNNNPVIHAPIVVNSFNFAPVTPHEIRSIIVSFENKKFSIDEIHPEILINQYF